MHKPVMVPETQGIRDYFNDDEILFFEAGSIENLAAKIEWAYRHPAELELQLQKGRAVYEQHNWNAEEKRFINLVAQLIGRK
jgi:glycosyltransferase involved in cell wall biosynthesis